jgi:hypothetical protein
MDRAETRVTASSGPVTLTLSLRRRRVTSTEELQFTIGLTNNGSAPIAVLDDAFVNGSRAIWPGGHSQTYIEVLDSHGRPAEIDFLPRDQTVDGALDTNSLDPGAVAAMRPDSAAAKKLTLAPGAGILTPAWPGARIASRNLSQKPNDYVALPGGALAPGDYKIRAVYRHSPTKWLLDFYRAHRKESIPPELVSVVTPFIGFKIEQ